MPREDIIVMSVEEANRLYIIRKILAKEIKQGKAGRLLGISVRQVRRLVRRVSREGDEGVVHQGRGKPSNRKIADEVREQVLKLYKEKYLGFGPTLANEKLAELDGIEVGTQTLRNWLTGSGLWQRQRKSKEAHPWRPWRECFGELVQMDGSHHDWLEGRGPKLVLMSYVDDATSCVFVRFYDYEGTLPAMDSFKRYIKRYGIPQGVYVDRHSTYKSNAKPSIEDELAGKKPLSQFERALDELGVMVVHAYSPQAKGRVERSFGTFQDRVIKEMRLAGVTNADEANAFLEWYLPIFNKKFSVQPAQKTDLHRPLLKGVNINDILCVKTERTVRNDLTIAYEKKVYQLQVPVDTKKVVIHDYPDGSMLINHNRTSLSYKEIPGRPAKANDLGLHLPAKTRKTYIPPKDHPWRRGFKSLTQNGTLATGVQEIP